MKLTTIKNNQAYWHLNQKGLLGELLFYTMEEFKQILKYFRKVKKKQRASFRFEKLLLKKYIKNLCQ